MDIDTDLLADTTELVEFFRACIAEDEAAAQAAAREHRETWHPVQVLASESAYVVDGDGMPVCANATYAGGGYIARYGPARALRDVAAKRAVLAAYEASVRRLGRGLSRDLLALVRVNAAVYSDDPRYNQDWALPAG